MTTPQTPQTPQTPATEGAPAHHHGPRMRWVQRAPEVYQAMIALDAAARKGIDPGLAELVKIRASQLNKCAFCLDMHLTDARKAGESEERLQLLVAWAEAPDHYTAKERAALALTEAITVLTDGFVPDDVYATAAAQFDETELAQLIALITTINAWNRFGVSTRMTPGKA
ncbi:alkyl hydroperoxide reductase AhpD [Streptomyces sp. NBRC 13847]|uniref:carboxymuconolactone decarboxylase family protein n=2 Tax=Streptomyces TaxID=1883 RepID=UPI0024A11FCB|nr:alkyl hydroperoxide reductase AhpD [Streptomyces sp. NBRC 13847]